MSNILPQIEYDSQYLKNDWQPMETVKPSNFNEISRVTKELVDNNNNLELNLGNVSVRQFANIEGMKQSNNLKVGDLVKTQGFYTASDGGGADYLITDDTGEDEADEASIISLQNGLYAKLIITNGFANPRQFGATGDGEIHAGINDYSIKYPASFYTEDGYNPCTNLPAEAKPFDETDSADIIGIQKAIWYASKNGLPVFIPQGNYVVTKSIVMNRDTQVSIYGSGLRGTKIWHAYANDDEHDFSSDLDKIDRKCLINIYRSSGQSISIKGFSLAGIINYSTNLPNNFTIIKAQNVNGLYLDDIWLTSCAIGVEYTFNCTDCHIYKVVSEYCFTATFKIKDSDVWIDGPSNFWQSSSDTNESPMQIENSKIRIKNSIFVGFGSQLKSDSDLFISNCDFINLRKYGGISTTKRLRLNNCTFSGATNGAMVACGSRSLIDGCTFTNNGEHSSINIKGESADKNKYSCILNNYFYNSITKESLGDYAIPICSELAGSSYVDGSEGLKIYNNIFEKIDGGTTPIKKITNSVLKDNTYINYTNLEGA